MTTPYYILLADDHVILRQGLRRIIDCAADLEVIGEADDGLALLELLKRLTADLVILDISMPHLRGLEAIHEAKAIHPHLKVLILTMHREIQLLNAAISAGAKGYLLKEDADTQLFVAIEKIRQGGIYVSPRFSDELTDEWARTRRGERSPAPQGEPLTIRERRLCDRRVYGWHPTPEGEPLTVREREVLMLTAEGKSSKEIADLLCISHRTVEHYRANIMDKLNLKKTVDIVRYAFFKGYL